MMKLSGLCVLTVLVLVGCKPYIKGGDQQQGSDTNSILGVGGSNKEFDSHYFSGYTVGPGTVGFDNPSESERKSFDARCAEYAKGKIPADMGKYVTDDFKENGCGIVCNPKEYTFTGTMKADERGMGHYWSCVIKPTKVR
jgi:hypothetical protein